MADERKKLRVLCLHGSRTNVTVMRDQTRALRAALGDDAEFVFLNGTHEAAGPSDATIEARYATSKPFYEWVRNRLFDGGMFKAGESVGTAKLRADDAPHGRDWGLSYEGLDETLAYMDQQLRALGPFDVVVGFSQGSMLLTVLTRWYLHHQNVTWWKLAVCVGGVRVSGINCRDLFVDECGRDIPIPLPSIHVVGRQDPLYEEGQKLVNMWVDHAPGAALPRIVLEHGAGHKFPSGSRDKELYSELALAIRKHFGLAEHAKL